jgi:hypothetical protein
MEAHLKLAVLHSRRGSPVTRKQVTREGVLDAGQKQGGMIHSVAAAAWSCPRAFWVICCIACWRARSGRSLPGDGAHGLLGKHLLAAHSRNTYM